MNLKFVKPIPVYIGIIIIGLAVFFHSSAFKRQFDFFERLEWVTYDKRVKVANRFPRPCATNLAFVKIDEVTVKILSDTNYNLSWPYPRQVHGRLVRELAAQRAKAIGFDVIFGELRPFDSLVMMQDNTTMESDDFFAMQMRMAGNVILAAEAEPIGKNLSQDENEGHELQRVFPPPLFETNAMAIGDIVADSDSDGVLRRARAFIDDAEHGRRWHMGILLAAKELGLDLDHAISEPGRLILNSTNGIQRTIPVDDDGFFYINWSITANDPRLTRMSYALPILLDEARGKTGMEDYGHVLQIFRSVSGETNLSGDNPMSGKLVVVGSQLIGNNLTDRGATPLSKKDFLVSKHWNVANSIITNQLIHRSSYWIELLIIILAGIIAAVATLQLRALTASLVVIAMIVAYISLGFFLFIQYRYWIPLVLPVIGAMLMTHVSMVTYRVRVEQNERRRVKAVFSRMVSPNVVNELLNFKKLSLGGARRQITVYFADVRGFTEMTDQHQSRAEEYVRENQLTGDVAEAHFDAQARETLAAVNLYLGIIADKIKEHNGTLDKYIGDCVMAFWGAPTPNDKHALGCVLAAIDSQRAMQALNEERAVENQKREAQNTGRIASGDPPIELLPILSLGSGINTGTIIAGLMGSDVHGLNYTVFGREVNLASRLEGVSGRGRIIIGEATYREILRDEPTLASTCIELPPEKVKGFRNAVKIYEVPWKINSEVKAPSIAGEPTAAAR
ncbi:MAG: adenylate/guanylate cyclase domain-containing protein [Verrucomicrobiota bacterium]